ncbi:hypothetical protein BS78_03G293200 [Paspalum vaginatum]|nr:hypothetical protein BS78_03G293200 [Paspalum vaginatum]
MGNNNVTGQQETINGVTFEPSNGSPGFNGKNTETNNEKDGGEDVNISKSSKDPIISNAEDKQVSPYQIMSSDKLEGSDEKSWGCLQDNTTTGENDQSNSLPKDDGPLRKEAIETTLFSTEIVALVSTIIGDVTSNEDNSISSEKNELMHGTRDTSEENIEGNYKSWLEESIECSLQDQKETSNHENGPVDCIAGEDTTENSEQGYIEVPTIEDKSVSMQGETASSTELIVSTYLDADDSEIKEVVLEDKREQRESPPDVKPSDDINIETSDNDNMQIQIPHDKEENSAISNTMRTKSMIESVGARQDDKNIYGLGNRDEDSTECTPCDHLYNSEVIVKYQSYLRNPTEIDDPELGNEQNDRVVGSGQISSSVTATVEHNVVEPLYKEEGIFEKTVAVWNLENNFAAEKGPEDYDGNSVSIARLNGNDFTGLHSSSLDHHLIVNEVKIQRVVQFDKETITENLGDKINKAGLGLHIDASVGAKEGGNLVNLPITTPSTPLQLLEDIVKEVYITRDTQETMTSSEGEHTQQIPPEEYEVVKTENGGTLSNCMQLVGESLNVSIISADNINHEKVCTNSRDSGITFEVNQKEVRASTAPPSFTVECNQAKVTASVDMAIDEQHPLQASTLGRDRAASEESPLLQGEQHIGFFTSTERNSQVDMGIPMNDVAVMQFKAEAEEESEKRPLLSPREPSGGDFRMSNHSARNRKPFQSLLTEGKAGMLSPLKEPEANTNSHIMVSSPGSKGKQKLRSSIFTSCMCCTTASE